MELIDRLREVMKKEFGIETDGSDYESICEAANIDYEDYEEE